MSWPSRRRDGSVDLGAGVRVDHATARHRVIRGGDPRLAAHSGDGQVRRVQPYPGAAHRRAEPPACQDRDHGRDRFRRAGQPGVRLGQVTGGFHPAQRGLHVDRSVTTVICPRSCLDEVVLRHYDASYQPHALHCRLIHPDDGAEPVRAELREGALQRE